MSDAGRRLLIFGLRRTRYALDLRDLAEVREPSATFPIPGAPRNFIGVMTSHGRPVAVLDMASFFGLGSAIPGGKILVLDRRHANLALWVDRVERIIPASQVSDEGTVDEEFTSRLLATGEGPLKLLELESLLELLEKGIKAPVAT